MKTKIICSKAYARAFRSELSETKFDLVWNNILQTGKHFYEFYKLRIPSIVENIPKYTGIEWVEFARQKCKSIWWIPMDLLFQTH